MRRNTLGHPCVRCSTVLTPRNSRLIRRPGHGEELRCMVCTARRQRGYDQDHREEKAG